MTKRNPRNMQTKNKISDEEIKALLEVPDTGPPKPKTLEDVIFSFGALVQQMHQSFKLPPTVSTQIVSIVLNWDLQRKQLEQAYPAAPWASPPADQPEIETGEPTDDLTESA